MKTIILILAIIFALGKVIYDFGTTKEKLSIRSIAIHGFIFLAFSLGIVSLLLRADIYFSDNILFYTLIAFAESLYLLTASIFCFFQIGRFYYLKAKKPVRINSLDDAVRYMASIGMKNFKVIEGKLIEHKESLYWAVQYEQFNGSLKNTLYISKKGKIIPYNIKYKNFQLAVGFS